MVYPIEPIGVTVGSLDKLGKIDFISLRGGNDDWKQGLFENGATGISLNISANNPGIAYSPDWSPDGPNVFYCFQTRESYHVKCWM